MGAIITSLVWEASGNVSRIGTDTDGDCWQTAWGDDGLLYTVEGDANYSIDDTDISPKKSMSFASVDGSPHTHTGTYIASNDETTGQGAAGKKPASMLSIDGRLYLWVRNADEAGNDCELWYSDNDSVDWTISTVYFSLGYCVFCQFGQDYAGAKDNYVYLVTPDTDSAYNPADDFLLLRVNKTNILTQSSYEYFSGLDGDGQPTWSSSSSNAASIMYNAGKCLRSGLSYNEAIGRYLWWQHDPTTGTGGGFDTRTQGGFYVYEAAELWGPWYTAYETSSWDMGPGESGHFPAKWMGELSGTTQDIYLIFSGNDKFSVRKATLTINNDPDCFSLDEIKSDTVALGSGATSVTDTLSPVLSSTDKAFLLFGMDTSSNQPGQGLIAGKISSTSQVSFERDASGTAIDLRYFAPVFHCGVSVEHGSYTVGASNRASPRTLSVNPVVVANSFPILTIAPTGGTYSIDDFAKIKLISYQLVEIAVASTGQFTNPAELLYQIIECPYWDVSTGEVTFASGDSSKTVSKSIDTSTHFVIASYDSASGTAADIGQKLVTWRLTSTQIVFERENTGVAITVQYYLVDINNTGTVQHKSVAFGSSDTQQDTSLATVTTSRAFVLVGGLYQRHGRTAYSSDDNPSRATADFYLSSTTNLRGDRTTTGTAADFEVQVIEFNILVSVDDAIALTDTPTVSIVSSGLLDVNVSDTVVLTDAPQVAIGTPVIDAQDGITVTDAPTLNINISVDQSDAFSLNDLPDLEINLDISKSDDITLADSINVNIDLAGQISIATLDTVNLIDTPQVTVSNLQIALDGNVTLVDTPGVLVAPTQQLNVDKSDTFNLGDTPQVTIGTLYVDKSDSFAIAESVSVSIVAGNDLVISITDVVNLTDSPEITISRSEILISDAITISDDLTVSIPQLEISTFDNVTLNDQVSLAQAFGLNVLDSLIIDDAVSLTPLLINLSLTDAFGLTDSPAISGLASSDIIDVELSDSAIYAVALSDAAINTITLTDTTRS